ncbi:hypothetical protein [Streptomyces sp. NPDC001502]|uniref:AbiJ-related protein n=1 Tax=Streptomyces sp. NPDC001502 TaxID=3364578 RepID=UPI00369AB12E
MALLGRMWHLDNDPLGGWTTPTNSLRSQIERHVIRFPDDWTTEQLFEQLGAPSKYRTPASATSSGAWHPPLSCPTSRRSAASSSLPTGP